MLRSATTPLSWRWMVEQEEENPTSNWPRVAFSKLVCRWSSYGLDKTLGVTSSWVSRFGNTCGRRFCGSPAKPWLLRGEGWSARALLGRQGRLWQSLAPPTLYMSALPAPTGAHRRPSRGLARLSPEARGRGPKTLAKPSNSVRQEPKSG